MKTILYFAIFLQVPFVALSIGPAALAQTPLMDSANSANDMYGPAEDGTHSVVNRWVHLNGATTFGAERQAPAAPLPASARGLPDPLADQFVQAGFQQSESQKKSAQQSTTQEAQKGGGSTVAKGARTDSASEPQPSQNPSAATSAPSNIDAATRAAGNASAALLASALTAPSENSLEGRPLSLSEVLGRGTNNTQRLEIASLYWKLALATGDYRWALDESKQLEALPANPGAVDSPLLATARAAAEAKTLEAKAAAVTVQQELADAIGQPVQSLPITVEQPLVGAYRTEFETIFAARTAPGRSRAIHRGLPLWREAIDLRSAGVQAAASAVQAAEAAYAEKNAGVETVLYAHRALSQERRAFLNAVRQYNAEIVEYASYVAGPTTSAATLMSMITRPKPVKLTSGSGTGGFADSKEPTPAERQFDPNVRAAAAEEEARDDQWRASGDRGDVRTPGERNMPSESQTDLKSIDERNE